MKPPLISVIIPTYHRNDLLAECLDRLAPGRQSLPIEQYEVIVTDDGYKTTAQKMICERYSWVKWVAGPRKGPAANRNNGSRFARGEWLVFTDDDCLPHRKWLSVYAQATKGDSLALEGAIHPLGELHQDMSECPVNLTGGLFWSANIAVKRSQFVQIGGFDSNYISLGEDVDLKERLSALTKIAFVPDARVDHPVRVVSLKQAIARIPKQAASNAYHMNKYKRASGHENAFDITFFHPKFTVSQIIRHLFAGKFKHAFVELITLLTGVPLLFGHLLRIKLTGVGV